MIKSEIYWRDILWQGEVNGRWAIGTSQGTLVADSAPNEADDLTFTAPNGKRYWDIADRSQWTPNVK